LVDILASGAQALEHHPHWSKYITLSHEHWIHLQKYLTYK
jgi:hypothetical protein